MEQKTSKHKCPQCGSDFEHFTAQKEENQKRPPAPGNYVICLHCATILRFDKGAELRVITNEEMKRLQQDKPKHYLELHRAQALVYNTYVKRQ